MEHAEKPGQLVLLSGLGGLVSMFHVVKLKSGQTGEDNEMQQTWLDC